MFSKLQERVSALPRFQPPALLPRDIRVAIEITINDRSPIAVTRLLRNGESTHIDANDLFIELTPRLYDSGMSVDFAWFANIAGQRRRIEAPASSERADGATRVRLSAVDGVRAGYFVTSSVRLVDCRPTECG